MKGMAKYDGESLSRPRDYCYIYSADLQPKHHVL